MKVLCIGHASYDISMPVDEYPKENTKYRIENVVECGGGPAATAAYLLGKWNIDTTFKGVVGQDVFGTRIIEEFKKVNVDTKYMELDKEVDTTISFILVNKRTGSRTLFNYSNLYAKFKNNNYEKDFMPDIIHMDGHNYNGSITAIEKFPNAITVLDAGRINDDLLSLANKVDYLVCSKGFAETVTEEKFDFDNPSTLISIMEKLEKKFKNIIVITLEERGCLIKEKNKIKIIAGLKVRAKDTTGAGDIFHGAFVYGLTKNFNLEEICKFSNITAGLSTLDIGTRNSIPDLEEVNEIFKENV